MEHFGIAVTVDSTNAFVVGGVATADVSSGSGFWIWYGKGNYENWLQKFSNFLFLFWVYASMFIIRESKNVFFYVRGKCVFATVKRTVPVFSVSSFHGIYEASKTNKKVAELLSMDHHRVPRMMRWAIHGTVHSVAHCQYFTKFSICYLSYLTDRYSQIKYNMETSDNFPIHSGVPQGSVLGPSYTWYLRLTYQPETTPSLQHPQMIPL